MFVKFGPHCGTDDVPLSISMRQGGDEVCGGSRPWFVGVEWSLYQAKVLKMGMLQVYDI